MLVLLAAAGAEEPLDPAVLGPVDGEDECVADGDGDGDGVGVGVGETDTDPAVDDKADVDTGLEPGVEVAEPSVVRAATGMLGLTSSGDLFEQAPTDRTTVAIAVTAIKRRTCPLVMGAI